MLGLGISLVALPVAIGQGLRARSAGGSRRGLGVAGLILGLFAILVPLSQVVPVVVSLITGGPDVPAPDVIECDCATARTGASFEIALVAAGTEGRHVTRRGTAESLVLEPESLVTLADVLSLSALRNDGGGISLLVSLKPEAAARLQSLAAPGKDIAVLIDGECVHDSRVVSPLQGSMMFRVPITVDEACALTCAVLQGTRR